MSNFFGDLIGRHKEQGSSSYAKPIVEPRPKARYEAESELPNEPLSDQQSSVAVNTSASEELSRNPKPTLPLFNQSPNLPTQSSSLDTIYDKETSRSERTHEMDVSEQIENLTALSPNGDFLKELSIPDRNSKEDQKPGLQLEELGIDGYGRNKGPLVADELDLRVQSILHRLRSSEKNHKSVDEDFSIDRKAMLSTNSENSNPTHSEHNDISSKGKFDEPSLNLNGNKSIQDAPGVARPLKTNPEGLLNTPNWLAGMQSDINKRWQHLNAKIESAKPVVNVTIGRVEVRAVQDSGLQAPKVQKKPSGVMSLNDYLKSRDKEERA
jgi:hypothetical protein